MIFESVEISEIQDTLLNVISMSVFFLLRYNRAVSP